MNYKKCCGFKHTIVEVRIVMSSGYSGKFSRRQFNLQLSRDNLGEQKVLKRADFFQAFKEPKMENFGNHGVTSGTYWVYYKPPVLSNSEVRTYDRIIRNNNSFLIFIILNNFLHENLVWILNHIGGIPFC